MFHKIFQIELNIHENLSRSVKAIPAVKKKKSVFRTLSGKKYVAFNLSQHQQLFKQARVSHLVVQKLLNNKIQFATHFMEKSIFYEREKFRCHVIIRHFLVNF